MFNLPSREDCQRIVRQSDAFYCTQTEVNGYLVEIYNYRLASFTDFEDNDAYELRGLTFIYNPETSTWERNILMNKFFNINQVSGTDLYEIELDNGIILQVNEEHNFYLDNGSVKTLKELSKNDTIKSWDVLT